MPTRRGRWQLWQLGIVPDLYQRRHFGDGSGVRPSRRPSTWIGAGGWIVFNVTETFLH